MCQADTEPKPQQTSMSTKQNFFSQHTTQSLTHHAGTKKEEKIKGTWKVVQNKKQNKNTKHII